MPVDSLHSSYEKYLPKWKRMRDVLDGEDAVHAAGTEYLPELASPNEITPDAKANAYKSYNGRAQFFNATARTRGSLEGFIERKDPVVTVPDAMGEFLADATLSGLSFYDVVKDTIREVLSVGRRGTLVDFDPAGENRPYLVTYCAEDIHNWRVERVDGQMVLTLLTLFELDAEPQGEPVKGEVDEFTEGEYKQWRVFRLETDAAGSRVRCTVYRKNEVNTAGKAGDFIAISDTYPTRRGVALTHIPFVFHGSNHGLPEPDRIPLEDMALVNLSLYRTSADLENGRHFCGIPTPWAAGFVTDKDKELVLGTSQAWVSENPNAKCGFLEFTGQGLQALQNAMEQKKAEMAALGARMLQPEAKKAEAFDTVAVRSAAETSALMSIAIACTQTLSDVLQWALWWMTTVPDRSDLSEQAKVELNTEFTVTALPADQITALTNAYLQGAMDWESYFWKMKQGDVFPPDADQEEVRTNIESNPPGLAQQMTDLQNGGSGAVDEHDPTIA